MPSLSQLYQQLGPMLPADQDGHELLWLLAHYTGLSKPELRRLLLRPDGGPELTPEQTAEIRQAVQRRAQNEPLQYITGLQPFWDFELIVTPEVLIPRWDSEAVLEQALQLLPKGGPCTVADVCCGSGAYALTIKKEQPQAQVIACDVSPAALAVARRNAAKYELEIEFRQGDLLAALPEDQQFNLIVSNPPYVEDAAPLPADVRQEPALALFGGPDGLDFYRRLTAEGVLAHLHPGGWLLLEIGCTQAEAVSELLAQAGFCNISYGQDLAGLNRWVQGQRPQA